jgi:hypothetical protein
MTPSWALAQSAPDKLDLRNCVVVLSPAASAREQKAARVLVEESEKRCGILWPIQKSTDGKAPAAPVTIYLATQHSAKELGHDLPVAPSAGNGLEDEGFTLRSGRSSDGQWITVLGGGERGLLFGVGKLLRQIDFARQQAAVSERLINLASRPTYKLRGHQLGYRPKTNAYDAWSVEVWDQYIRELAIFGINSIELIPPQSDDLPDSPQFLLPPEQMMVHMSRIADSYGLDVWVWYPAMDRDYSDSATIENSLTSWGRIFSSLARVDAVFVPGGDPGHTQPKYLLALLERQKQNLRKYHPKGEMWVSPQGFDAQWMQEFLDIVHQPHTMQWLDGIVYGPMSRLPEDELRRALPPRYPIRCYPDITHSAQCQYPVPDWDVAFALTEGREVINPRPRGEANILQKILPGTRGFISYSEGCNDDVNKFIWSALGWDPTQPVTDVLRDYAHYFIGAEHAEGFAQGLLSLELNWHGPLEVNRGVELTLGSFADLERSASPALLRNWRFQQPLYRAYFDAYVRRRLLEETARVAQARDTLERVLTIGWGAVPLNIGAKPPKLPPNALSPSPLLDEAQGILQKTIQQPAGVELRSRMGELAEALFQSIGMQLAVERYQAEAVGRAANLDTADTPVSDAMWMLWQVSDIRRMDDPMAQIAAIRSLISRTDPGLGGFYDQLGDVANRPHLITGPGGRKDPDFRTSALIGFRTPDTLQDEAPMAWKCWAESFYDAPLTMRYTDLDRQGHYRLRVVHSGNAPQMKLRLVANGTHEIHPFVLRAWPPAPQEFAIPQEATSGGELTLAWTREPGQGGNGGGCQVAEVWLILVSPANV